MRACLCCFQETLHRKCCQGVTKEGELLIKIKQACLAWLSREVFFKNFSVNHLRPGYANTHRNSDNSYLSASTGPSYPDSSLCDSYGSFHLTSWVQHVSDFESQFIRLGSYSTCHSNQWLGYHGIDSTFPMGGKMSLNVGACPLGM